MRVAAIDVGSNALRCMVVEGRPGTARMIPVEDRRAAVRLGADAFGPRHRIRKLTMERAAEAMRAFHRDLHMLRVDSVRAVATAAVRECRNRTQFLTYLTRKSGISLEVISGAEEARLISLAVRQRVPTLREGRHAILDVGGGSAEVILVEDGEVSRVESFKLGTVRLLGEIGLGVAGARFLRMARVLARGIHQPVKDLVGTEGVRSFSATGGNIETLARLVGRRLGKETRIHQVSRGRLERLVEEMALMKPVDRMEKWGLKADRADVIVPAGVIYSSVARAVGARSLVVPHVGLRDAVALDLLLNARVTDARRRLGRARISSAVGIGRKFRFNEGHARRTAKWALVIFDRMSRVAKLDEEDRPLLEMAALLHDIGLAVSPIGHHKHSAYLIRQSEIAGVTPEEQEMVALIARYHRRSHPKKEHEEFARLSPSYRKRVTRLAAILRLADALDRDRIRPLRDVEAKLVKGRLKLVLHGQGDRLLEIWAAGRKSDLFEMAFDRDVRVSTAAP
jgi:exopolyphosphatase/guanosine-5'-triphosphate,3'-diphosphate pyrophosphatase